MPRFRALNPWPGTWANLGSETDAVRLKILESSLEKSEMTNENKNRPVGTLIDKSGHIACGNDTIIRVLKIQPAGKQAMDITSAINGNYIRVGECLT